MGKGYFNSDFISGQSIYYIDSVGILCGNYFTGDYGYGKIGRMFSYYIDRFPLPGAEI